MKTTFTTKELKATELYPALYLSTSSLSELIVLKTSKEEGCVVHSPNHHMYTIGYYSRSWDDRFIRLPSSEIVTLSN